MSLKNFIRTSANGLIKNNFLWSFVKPFANAGTILNTLRKDYECDKNAPYNNDFSFLFKDKEVLHGPFKGLKYSSYSSVCSTIYPKLLGSYEMELNTYIEELCKNDYSEIIDIGCAEGYYAVGFALKKPQAKVFAYDTLANARVLCLQMAKLNGVDNRMEIRSFCSAEELQNFTFTKRGLIISDCEGFEGQLFNKNNISNLKNCDLIIETHETVDINISTYLHNLFSQTHHIATIKSVDDIEKAKTYMFEETQSLNLLSRKRVFQEERPIIMEWLVCVPKTTVEI